MKQRAVKLAEGILAQGLLQACHRSHQHLPRPSKHQYENVDILKRRACVWGWMRNDQFDPCQRAIESAVGKQRVELVM
jgi:hypothetical protein